MRMPAVSQESCLCTIRLQASEQEWQPMQRSMRGVVRIFMAFPLISEYRLLRKAFDTDDTDKGYDEKDGY